MRCTVAFALAGLFWSVSAAPAAPSPAPAPSTADAPSAPADLTLGGETILRLRAAAGGLTPQQRVDTVQGRIAALLGTPNIKPSDVTVYAPAKGAPVIYALGRRLLTVDTATVRAAGTASLTPLDVASQWAKRLQQVLPRICWRPSNAPDTVVPANPPLLVTPDLARVGGNTGLVTLRGKTILALHGPQHGGLTAQERADILSARLERLANIPPAPGGAAVMVVSNGLQSATLLVSGQPFFSAGAADAKAAGVPSFKLADLWAGRIRAALLRPDANALPAAVSAPAPVPPSLPAPVLPAPPAPASDTPPAPSAPAAVVPPAAP